jgi:uncharacterized protein YggE
MVVEIMVRGEAEQRYPAERAVVTLAASFEDGAKQTVYDAAVSAQQAITAQATELANRGAVSTWSSEQVAVSSYRPWLDGDRRGEPVHVARVGIAIEFVDFTRLSGFLDYWAGRDGVEISGIAWDVLERNRRTYESELRKAAVSNAVSKAQAYADALRRGRVLPTRLADAGLLDPAGGSMPYALKAEASMAEGGGIRLTPDSVLIRVAVDAGFTAE